MTVATIIIAAYRAESFIAGALDSALAQAGVEVELIVIDDASPDDTAAAVSHHLQARGAGCARLLRQAVNGGPAAARNRGLREAQGEWVAVLDADDRMSPGRLAALITAAEQHSSDVILDNLWVCDETGAHLRRHIDEPDDGSQIEVHLEDYALANLMFSGRPALGYLKPVFRTSFLRRHAITYDPGLRIGEDFLIVAEALAHGARVTRLRQTLYDYTARHGSISHRLSPAEVRRMSDADSRFLTRHEALSGAARRAMLRHRVCLDDAYAFLEAMAALKEGAAARALRHALSRPMSLRHLHMPLLARAKRLLDPREGAAR